MSHGGLAYNATFREEFSITSSDPPVQLCNLWDDTTRSLFTIQSAGSEGRLWSPCDLYGPPLLGTDMARRKHKKTETAELDLWIPIKTDVGTESKYLDIGQCLSLANRKFYRQGMQYAVADVELVTAGAAMCQISRLPHSWVMANAWEKAFRLWQESQDQVLDTEPSIKSRYNDFKIFLEYEHYSDGVGDNLLPANYSITGATSAYDWDMSHIQIPNDGVPGNTEEWALHAIGPDGTTGTSVGVITGYADSRSRPHTDDPNKVQSRGWMGALFDVGDNLMEIREDIVNENDSPPYLIGEEGSSIEYYPGGSLQHPFPQLENVLAVRSGTSSVGRQMGQGFLASCGLLKITTIVTDAPPVDYTNFLRITLMPGDYKGVAARPMKDVN